LCGLAAVNEVTGTSQALLVKHSSAAKNALAQERAAGVATWFKD